MPLYYGENPTHSRIGNGNVSLYSTATGCLPKECFIDLEYKNIGMHRIRFFLDTPPVTKNHGVQ